MTPFHKIYLLLSSVFAIQLFVGFGIPRIKRYAVARVNLSLRLQRFVVRFIGWPGMLGLAKASPHNEPGLCLQCEARQHENRFKHVEKTYVAGVKCVRCGLAKEYFRTLPKCKGKRL